MNEQQQQLFDAEPPVSAISCLGSETARALSPIPDTRTNGRLTMLATKLRGTDNPLDRAKLAAEVRDIAEAIIGSSIRDANGAGTTWREIGAALGVPFQTLYGRYGDRP